MCPGRPGESEKENWCRSQPIQGRERFPHRKAIYGCLREYSHESKLGDGAGRGFERWLLGKPDRQTPMEEMIFKAQGDQRIHIEKEDHGKSASISATCSLVNGGAPGPALSTGQPVSGSSMIPALKTGFGAGLRTMQPSRTAISTSSPARAAPQAAARPPPRLRP